ncbi:MAG TPA: phosphate ABC transporter permease PstA [Egibacteraceae bacterium]|nr:phosphate ABC transporter permease PstA [Egibacteraceae bacterium]
MAISTPERTARAALAGLDSQRRQRRVRERAFAAVLVAATGVSVAVLAVLLIDVVIDGAGRLNLDFLRVYASRFPERTGIRAGLTGTLSLMLLVAATAFPIGVGAAVYLEEFAPDNRLTRLLEANINTLAGVPSIVYGLLGAAVFVYMLEMGRSLISGALTLALLILPVIIVASRESLRAVPRAIRDGGLALGATPLQVTWRQLIPAALPGILTGTILSLSRAIGEAAPILVVGAVFSRRADSEPWNLLEAFTALPIEIFNFVSRPQEGFKIDAAAAAIIVLMAILLLLNSTAILLRNRFSRRW